MKKLIKKQILFDVKKEIIRSPGIRQCSLFDLVQRKYGYSLCDTEAGRSKYGFAIWAMLKMDHEVIRVKTDNRLSYVI